jgi:hypothetical protein
LLEMSLLAEIKNREQDEPGCSHSQHSRLQAIKEARFHWRRSTSAGLVAL